MVSVHLSSVAKHTFKVMHDYVLYDAYDSTFMQQLLKEHASITCARDRCKSHSCRVLHMNYFIDYYDSQELEVYSRH